MSSPFDFEVVLNNNCSATDYFSSANCFSTTHPFREPISVLDSIIRSAATSSSTLSSSLGGGATSTDTAGVAAVSDRNPSPKSTSSSAGGVDSDLLPVPPSLEVAGGRAEKCAMEDWECVLSESADASPAQEQSIFRWVVGDVEDPASNGCLNKFLQFSAGAIATAAELEFDGGFGVVDQAFPGENLDANFISSFSSNNRSNDEKIVSSNPVKFHQNPQNLMSPTSVAANSVGAVSFHNQAAFDSSLELKPLILNPQLLLNQQQAQSFLLPFSFTEEREQSAAAPPPAKRINSGSLIPNSRQQGMFVQMNHQPQQQQPHQSGGDELQQWIMDNLLKAAELLQTGNPSLAQGILARLNHHLSPIGNPFQRAAFYCKEALQLLLHNTTTTTTTTSLSDSFPLSLVLKIGAYKSFSEVSPIIDFANFTCNQALLEALKGFDRIHIVDFDIGYGGQWASLMQELALRIGGAPALRITAIVSRATHNPLELSLTRENLIQYANEINIGLELDFVSSDSLRSGSFPLPLHQKEAVGVILPVGCLTNYQLPAPLVLRFVKQLSPRVVVSMERECDRAEVSFPNHITQAIQWHKRLLESLDGVNMNRESQQRIERLLVQPGMEKLVVGRFGTPQKWQQWRSVFVSCGLSPVAFSNWTEWQAECLVKRSGVAGFGVEKKQSSLALCWQRKELLSASLWR